jgi:transposase-like protein
MPWMETTSMSFRSEFNHLAGHRNANIRELCRRFGISRKTGYKWLKRYRDDGGSIRLGGGRKIKTYVERKGHTKLSSPSTITEILGRNGQIDAEEARKHRPYQRFEKEHPNQLRKMNFKGYFSLEEGGYCHPLSVLDDHSRFLLVLKACPNETRQTVQEQLTELFSCYGLPKRMLMDNGSPLGQSKDSLYYASGGPSSAP